MWSDTFIVLQRCFCFSQAIVKHTHSKLLRSRVYNGLVDFASPLVTDRESESTSPVSAIQTSFAAGINVPRFMFPGNRFLERFLSNSLVSFSEE